ncbi:MAG: 50S ribosomal protein L24 [Acidobacteria bacterium]|nr:MAG: 50S ribosomal protein L24 [Acidobacteriota bacterium]
MQVGKVRKKDTVVVIAGKDSGKRGKVLRIVTKKSAALVEGVNFVKRHTKPNPQKNVKGGIVEREAPVHLSNLMVICPECGEAVRIGHRRLEDGRKVRICRACSGVVDR